MSKQKSLGNNGSSRINNPSKIRKYISPKIKKKLKIFKIKTNRKSLELSDKIQSQKNIFLQIK